MIFQGKTKMFPKNLLVSFTAIVVLLTSNIPCNYSKKLPKVSNTPGSSDISGFSQDDTYVTAKFSRDPWNSRYMPFANLDFSQGSASSKDQQSPLEFQESVQTPDGVGLNGWGRIPRVPKPDDIGLDGWGRIPRIPKPDGLGLDGWGRIPRPPKLSDPGSLHVRVPPSMEALPRKSAFGPTNPASPPLDLLDPRH